MAVDALARAIAAGKVPVTAYEMAVKAGYTGTEEQFAQDMGNSGTNAANAAASASAAAASAESIADSAAQIATNTSDISDLKTQLNELEEIYFDSQNDVDVTSLTKSKLTINRNYNWYLVSGNVAIRASYILIPSHTKKLTVTAAEANECVISFIRTYDPDTITSGPVDGYGREVIPAGTTKQFDIPNNAPWLYMTRNNSSGDDISPAYLSFEFDVYVKHDDYDKDMTVVNAHIFGNKKYEHYIGNNNAHEFTYKSVKRGNRLRFRANFTTVGEMQIGYKNINNDFTTYISVTENNISMKFPNVNLITMPHGINLVDELTVEIYNDIEKIYIKLISNGQEYTYNRAFMAGYSKGAYILTNSVISYVDFTYSADDIMRDIWMFGDSYFSYGANRWVYYLITNGYSNNCLIDAYAGEGSERSVVSFDNLVSLSTPKYILWAIGMNDGSDGQNANSTWMNAVNHVEEVCEAKGICLVMATIPTVPTINHEKKNEYIRSSGHLYIDFAKAVGAQSDGTWFDGMLETATPSVHPTQSGAIALYNEAVSDFPVFTMN